MALDSALPVLHQDADGQVDSQPYVKVSAFCWSCFSDSSSLGHGEGSVCGFTNCAEQQA